MPQYQQKRAVVKTLPEGMVANLQQEPPALIRGMQNSRSVRWYVLALPVCHRGTSNGLQTELDRRRKMGEPLFEFFAPVYVEVKKKNGAWIETNKPLLFNYVFVRASENEIYRMMKTRLPRYSFLPRIRDGRQEYYPYLSDEAMENLRWVAQAYANTLPVCIPDSSRLMKGDKVRITEGRFKDTVATVVIQPGAGQKDIMVCIENWLYVPLFRVHPGQYEIIALNADKMHLYARLNNDRTALRLHEALCRYCSSEGVTAEDRSFARETLAQYGSLMMESDVTRCKLYAILLPAYTILDDRERCGNLLGAIRTLLPQVKAEQAKALLLVTLYGCTANLNYGRQAHEVIDPWRNEKSLKKQKRQLLQRLADYDDRLVHRSV